MIDKIIGGWNVSGILTEQSGFPLALHATVAGGGNRPNLVPGVTPKLPGSRPLAAKVTEWFNTAAFAQPPAFTLGNVSRTIGSVRSPALKNPLFSAQVLSSSILPSRRRASLCAGPDSHRTCAQVKNC